MRNTKLAAGAGVTVATLVGILILAAHPKFGAPGFANPSQDVPFTHELMGSDGTFRDALNAANEIEEVSLRTEDNKDLVTPEVLARKQAELIDENRRLIRENERLLRELNDVLEENRRVLGEISQGRQPPRAQTPSEILSR